MSTAARPRIGRSYTRARRYPWVLGTLGDWRIPMGPYTPPQLAVASVGALVLIKTVTWWAPVLGPVPVLAWGFAIWAARHSRIGGRSPFAVAADALSLAVSPRSGRIGGRAVRDPRPVRMTGGFGLEGLDMAPAASSDLFVSPLPSGAEPSGKAVRACATDTKASTAPPIAPLGRAMTPLQQILAAAAARSDTTPRENRP
ncbi:hypothetical protein AB0A71_31260 [Kitasatospora aureofaciens]|uniref:hypothetical protein n=1 Tax=Kitasatospora aureofaciens TaxID=1894 RepID=UPI0033CF05CB